MTPPAVSAPPPPAATRAAVPAPALLPRARAPLSRPLPPRPPLLTPRALAVSVALHLVFLLLVVLAPEPPRPAAVPAPAGTQTRETVEYLDVGQWGDMATEVAAAPPAPAVSADAVLTAAAVDSVLSTLPTSAFPDRVPTGIPAAPAGPAAGQPGGAPAAGGVPGGQPGAAGQGRTGIGRLGPELGDPRLVVRPTAVPETPLSDEERYQRHFESRLRAFNDSIAGEEESRRRRNDWTITDRNGRKWGINERGPVLGGRNVPVPIPLPNARPSREQEDAARRERDQRREIDRQAEDIERGRYLRERGKATRERNDRDREQGQQGGNPPSNP